MRFFLHTAVFAVYLEEANSKLLNREKDRTLGNLPAAGLICVCTPAEGDPGADEFVTWAENARCGDKFKSRDLRGIVMNLFKWLFVMSLTAVICCGCYYRRANNHLTEAAFLEHLENSGIDVETVQYIDPDVISARRAVAIKLKDNPWELGLYIYDIDREDHMKKLDFIYENGFIYIHGNKYPTLINGSFVLIGYEKNPLKHELIKAMETF